MKMLTDTELARLAQDSFFKGFEACRGASIKVCRQRHGDPDISREKLGYECANEIARLTYPLNEALALTETLSGA
jgi:hypothetical protein